MDSRLNQAGFPESIPIQRKRSLIFRSDLVSNVGVVLLNVENWWSCGNFNISMIINFNGTTKRSENEVLIRAQRHLRCKLCHQAPFTMNVFSWPVWMHQRGAGDFPTTVSTKRQIFLCEPCFRILCCAIGSLVLWSYLFPLRARYV